MKTVPEDVVASLQQAWPNDAAMQILPLSLRQRYDRAHIYGLFKILFTQRNRTLIQGLSPQLPDGGYCIFITLDKTAFDSAYDYEDQLYEDSFEWVTRRGVGESHRDYVALRNPRTRVSLFVRNKARELFAYLGELTYLAHTEFRSKRDDRTQLKYLFQLQHPVPDALLQALTGGVSQPTTVKGRSSRKSPTRTSSQRRPATLEGARQALAYVLGDLNRIMVPAHHNYQVRLKHFLTAHGVSAEWERGFVDVRFLLNGDTYIGEIKVTTYLSVDEAFRTALGQLIFYAHIGFEKMPRMIMLLDAEPDSKRVELASRHDIAVVVERKSEQFVILNPQVLPRLSSVFSTAHGKV
jgi:hypothetical protein